MTGPLLRADLRALARCGGTTAALLIVVLAIGLVSVAWFAQPLDPWMPGAGLWPRQLATTWLLLALIVPWATSRFLSVDRGDALVWTAAQAGVPPSAIAAGKLLAAFVYAGLLLLLSAPFAVVAYLAGAAGPAEMLTGYAGLLAFAAVAVATGVLCSLRAENRLASWMLSTTLTAGALAAYHLVASAAGPFAGIIMSAAAAAAGAALAIARASRTLMYLRA